MGVKINYEVGIIEWNESVTLFKPLCALHLETKDTTLHEYDMLALIKEAEDSYDKKMSDNKYSSKD